MIVRYALDCGTRVLAPRKRGELAPIMRSYLGARTSGPHIDLTVNERNLIRLGARASGPHSVHERNLARLGAWASGPHSVHERNLVRLGTRASGPQMSQKVNERNLVRLGMRASGPQMSQKVNERNLVLASYCPKMLRSVSVPGNLVVTLNPFHSQTGVEG
jgi:hypothetical protein